VATITIGNLDDRLKARLHIRAAHYGRSMEDEARDIIRTALAAENDGSRGLVQSIRSRLAPLGGVELDVPAREPMREPPDLNRRSFSTRTCSPMPPVIFRTSTAAAFRC